MKKRIDAILWRKSNLATLDTLRGESAGQYDIRLTSRDFGGFFLGVARTKETELGGYTLEAPVAPFTGTSPIGAENLVVRYMGDDSKRKDWNIPSQRPDTAYGLWRVPRGAQSSGAPGDREYLVIARDTERLFHPRWIRSEDFGSLPSQVQQLLQAAEAGWGTI